LDVSCLCDSLRNCPRRITIEVITFIRSPVRLSLFVCSLQPRLPICDGGFPFFSDGAAAHPEYAVNVLIPCGTGNICNLAVAPNPFSSHCKAYPGISAICCFPPCGSQCSSSGILQVREFYLRFPAAIFSRPAICERT